MSIQELLTNWKNESLYSERHFERLLSTPIEGQELYLVSMKCIVGNDKKIIEKQKFFQTHFQGVNETDEYKCKQILLQLESDFFKELNAIFDEGARNLSDSFINL
jgi:hypothetical protein